MVDAGFVERILFDALGMWRRRRPHRDVSRSADVRLAYSALADDALRARTPPTNCARGGDVFMDRRGVRLTLAGRDVKRGA